MRLIIDFDDTIRIAELAPVRAALNALGVGLTLDRNGNLIGRQLRRQAALTSSINPPARRWPPLAPEKTHAG